MTTEPIPAEAAQARIDAATAQGIAGDLAEQTTETTEAVAGDDDLLSTIPDDITYRDAARLRDEMRTTRTRYKPLEDALGTLDEESRRALLDVAPALGDDLSTTAQVFANLTPSDRQAFLALADAWVNDRDRAVAMFGETAKALSGGLGAGPAATSGTPSPAGAPPPQGAPASSEYLTREQFQAELAQYSEAQQYAQAEAQARSAIYSEARDLGYNPDAPEGSAERAMYLTLCQLAVEQNGDLKAAAETMTALREWTVAEYLDGKRADAGRTAPVFDGAGSAPEGRKMETMADAQAAVEARLNAALGPDPVAALRGT